MVARGNLHDGQTSRCSRADELTPVRSTRSLDAVFAIGILNGMLAWRLYRYRRQAVAESLRGPFQASNAGPHPTAASLQAHTSIHPRECAKTLETRELSGRN